MNQDLPTLLQALYGSGELQGYICSVLPKEGLRTGWLEQGLTLKGLKSSLSTKTNQSRYVRPTEHIIRLICDRAMSTPKNFGMVIVGRGGLSTEKMFVILVDSAAMKGSKWAMSFWSKTDTPFELVRLVNKSVFGSASLEEYKEPNIDYVEQMKEDSSDGLIKEAIVLQMPKGLGDEASWLKSALAKNGRRPDHLLFSHGTLNESPAFALLFSKALSDFESLPSVKDSVFASFLVKPEVIEVVLWDRPRGMASFVVFKKTSLDRIAWKYLLPLWATSDDSFEVAVERMRKLFDTKEATLQKPGTEEASSTDKEIKLLENRLATIDESLSKVDPQKLSEQISLIEKRSESLRLAVIRINELERALKEANTENGHDSTSLDFLQNRLQAIIDRMQTLAEKLGMLEARITAITDAWSEE